MKLQFKGYQNWYIQWLERSFGTDMNIEGLLKENDIFIHMSVYQNINYLQSNPGKGNGKSIRCWQINTGGYLFKRFSLKGLNWQLLGL